MLRAVSCVLAMSIVLLLTGCHCSAGYLSQDPELTYGPGVVEFPDPVRAYLPAYAHGGAVTSAGRSGEWAGPRDVEVIFVEYPATGPATQPHSTHVTYPAPPSYGHSGYSTPTYSPPVKGGRRVRRAAGQPLGVNFTD